MVFAPPKRGFRHKLLNFYSCTQDKFVMVLAPALRSAQGTRICPQLKYCTVINFWLRDCLYPMTLPSVGQGLRHDTAPPHAPSSCGAGSPSLHPMTIAFSSVRVQDVTAYWLKYQDHDRMLPPTLRSGQDRVTVQRGRLAPSLEQSTGLFLNALPSILPGR